MNNNKLKIMVIVTVVLMAVFMVAGCSSSVKYTDGTYDGVGVGIHGDVNVEVKVAEGKISQVSVVSHNETEGVGTMAINDLPEMIVEAQSTEVEVVTGATITSNAIIEAVNSALETAK
ncbi:MAG: FMN-binding protein [Eubacteriaceae bacterium]